MNIDFHTADNADFPHVKIYDADTDDVICEIPIHDTGDDTYDIERAELIAEFLMESMRANTDRIPSIRKS